MFKKVDLGREISGKEFETVLRGIAKEWSGEYYAYETKGEEVLVLGSVHTEHRGGTLQPVIEVPYTVLRGRLIQSKKVICSFGTDILNLFNEKPVGFNKDGRYQMIGLRVSVESKPVGLGRAIALIPIFGWLWAIALSDTGLRRFGREKQEQVGKDVVFPLFRRLGELLESTPEMSHA